MYLSRGLLRRCSFPTYLDARAIRYQRKGYRPQPYGFACRCFAAQTITIGGCVDMPPNLSFQGDFTNQSGVLLRLDPRCIRSSLDKQPTFKSTLPQMYAHMPPGNNPQNSEITEN